MNFTRKLWVGGSIGGDKLVLVNSGADADAAFAIQGFPPDDSPLAVDADTSSLAHLRRQGHEKLDFRRETDFRGERKVDSLGADVAARSLDGGTGVFRGTDFDRDRKLKPPVSPLLLRLRGGGA